MTNLFFPTQTGVAATNAKGISVPATGARPFAWNVYGSWYQYRVPWLRKSIDMWALSKHVGFDIGPPYGALRPAVQAALGADMNLLEPQKALGRAWINFVRERLASSEEWFYSLPKTDLVFGRDILNPRMRFFSRCNEFLFNGKETRVRWLVEGTKTGRARIRACAVNPLNLKKADRSRITSTESHHTIIQVDFKAIEFRLALKRFGVDDAIAGAYDPYEALSQEIGLTGDRAERKRALIAALYGGRIGHFDIPDREKANLLIWFSNYIDPKRNAMIDAARESVLKSGYYRTSFGRRLYQSDDVSDRVITNNRFQSEGADLAFYQFAHLLDLIDEQQLDAFPVFSIHDSCVLSASSEAERWLMNNVSSLGQYPVDWSAFSGG